MSSGMKCRILDLLALQPQGNPSAAEFEMAYQGRAAIDRIKFAIKHAEQFWKPCVEMRDMTIQLLDALARLESADRHFQARSRTRAEGILPQSHNLRRG
jgi:hypothetical protein